MVRTTGLFTKLLLNLVNLRILFRVGTKLKESILKNNNQINYTVTMRAWDFSTEWTRTLPSTGLVFEWKNVSGPRLCKWYMLFFKVCRNCIVLKKIKAMSQLFKKSYQCNFCEIFKGRQIIFKPCRNLKYAIRCLLWWHRALAGAIWEKQGRCKVCKKNSRRCYLKCKPTWYMFWNISMILANVWLRKVRFENLWISSV